MIPPETDFTTGGFADDDSQLGGIIQKQDDDNASTRAAGFDTSDVA